MWIQLRSSETRGKTYVYAWACDRKEACVSVPCRETEHTTSSKSAYRLVMGKDILLFVGVREMSDPPQLIQHTIPRVAVYMCSAELRGRYIGDARKQSAQLQLLMKAAASRPMRMHGRRQARPQLRSYLPGTTYACATSLLHMEQCEQAGGTARDYAWPRGLT